ncbi:hypothetical protein KDW_49690 [Dictyobacter vulcani]|uniref:Uncharacterized protein n=1 Tax=Dictyobacter vulcani TaxID=2607529 RepID=A0A5J4KW95_9CHLR|nr:hypothetical protein [Dictyobacter vulcani]GER90807.1 hypothetical protein KDW_49690 [Dictyobacter vulcani]
MMKKNDSGDFSVLYVEPEDDKLALFPVIAGQKKPIVLMLAEQARTFQRPDDFTMLKHIKRQYELTIIFVISHSGQLAQLAAKNGFPVYQSMEQLVQAVSSGQLVRQRALTRPTIPLENQVASGIPTRPLQQPPRVTQPNLPPVIPSRQPPVVAPQQLSPVRTQSAAGIPSRPTFRANQPEPVLPTMQPFLATSAEPIFPTSQSSPVAAPQQQQPLPVVTPPKARSKRLPTMLTVITGALILAIIGSFLIFSHSFQSMAVQTPAPTSVGRLSFISSGQVNENTSQGIADQVVLDVHSLPNPGANKKYYAWLLGDKNQNDPTSIALGALNVSNGNAHLMYPGDSQHSNLLLTTSRVLLTEEDATVTPMSPSMDTHSWRYYGEFSSTPIKAPDNVKNYSYLDHLRHLLASDPTLNEVELPGGLNNWLYRNTSKIVEWTGSMRETWEDTKDSAFIRRQTMRVLAYLDGTTFLYKDLPPKSPLLVNERLARVGLLEVNGPNQEPPSYMAHIDHHLRGLLQADDASAPLRKQMNDLTTSMSDINSWLSQVRSDAQKIVKMDDNQIKQPMTLTLINDMIANSNHAFAGQLDPSTNQMRQGVIWLHDHMESLATLDLTPVKPGTSSVMPQMVPGQLSPRAFVPYRARR